MGGFAGNCALGRGVRDWKYRRGPGAGFSLSRLRGDLRTAIGMGPLNTITTVKRTPYRRGFDQALELLRVQGFDVAPYAGIAGSVLVSKHGAGAVLVRAPRDKGASDSPAAFAVHPGLLVKGEVGRLLDRGYQKFIKTSKFELPAAASQLQAIHAFSEELKQLVGSISLYNESLGTTSDVYRYDRLVGREAAQPEPGQPWEQTGGH